MDQKCKSPTILEKLKEDMSLAFTGVAWCTDRLWKRYCPDD